MIPVQKITATVESMHFDCMAPYLVVVMPKLSLVVHKMMLDRLPMQLHDELRPGLRVHVYFCNKGNKHAAVAFGNNKVTYFGDRYQSILMAEMENAV